jgi:endogenous inhibitor of DNA gyrase (YacG/DUF329 family)
MNELDRKTVRLAACPICGRPVDAAFKPFCSKRCADVDLNRWFSGGYAIPAVEEDDPDDETPPQQR